MIPIAIAFVAHVCPESNNNNVYFVQEHDAIVTKRCILLYTL